jgi:hypothetical protein
MATSYPFIQQSELSVGKQKKNWKFKFVALHAEGIRSPTLGIGAANYSSVAVALAKAIFGRSSLDEGNPRLSKLLRRHISSQKDPVDL